MHIVANLATNDEAFVADDSIGGSANGPGGRVVDEGAAVEVGLLEVEVDLLALVAGSRVEVGEDLSLQAAGKGVVELDLGGQEVGRVPRLGDADACAPSRQKTDAEAGGCLAARRLRQVENVRGEGGFWREGY